MRKIFITLTTMALALCLAAAAPAQGVKTSRQAKFRNTKAASKEAAAPAAKEEHKPGDKKPKAMKPGHRTKHKPKAKKRAHKTAKRGKGKKRAGAHMITPQKIK